jgi:hypothetical protein
MSFELLSTGQSITAVMSGAPNSVNPTYSVRWADTYSGAKSNAPVGSLNGATPVTLVSAPDGYWQREVAKIRLYNGDDAAVTVTISKVSGGTSYTLAKVTLQPGDHLTLDHLGFLVNDASGAVESINE